MIAALDTQAAAEALQDAGRDELAAKAEIAALESRLTWRMTGIVAALLVAQGALIVVLLQPAVSWVRRPVCDRTRLQANSEPFGI